MGAVIDYHHQEQGMLLSAYLFVVVFNGIVVKTTINQSYSLGSDAYFHIEGTLSAYFSYTFHAH